MNYFTIIEEIKALVLTDKIPSEQNVDIIGWRPSEGYCGGNIKTRTIIQVTC